MNIDSPGGEASGMHELAQAVYDMRDTMHITAYVGGSGASAAYWLASAAHQIVVDPTAILGSIGVQVAFAEPTAKAGEKVYKFVSSQSPNKNADAGTKAGAPKSSKPLMRWRKFSWSPSRAIAAWLLKRSLQTSAKAASSLARRRWRPDWRTPSVPLRRSSRTSPQGTATRNQRESRQPWPTKLPSPRKQRDSAVTAAVTAERARIAGLTRLATAHNAHGPAQRRD
jgi:hypothetical protein